MHTKCVYVHCNCSIIRSLSLASFKVCLCVIVLSVTICTVGYVCSFHRHQTFVDFVSFLSISFIYIIMYTICSAWFLDIRISPCYIGYQNINYVICCTSTTKRNLYVCSSYSMKASLNLVGPKNYIVSS